MSSIFLRNRRPSRRRGVWATWLGCALLEGAHPNPAGSIRDLYLGIILDATTRQASHNKKGAKKFPKHVVEELYYRSLRELDKRGGILATLHAPSPRYASSFISSVDLNAKWIYRIVDLMLRIQAHDGRKAGITKL